VIGLDGFHEDLLKHTPFIQSLYRKCSSGKLRSTHPPVTAPAWASFQTGRYQGSHGIYDFVTHDENFDINFNDGRDLKSKTFYEMLDEAGYQCLLYNLPFSFPPRVNGDVVPSWLEPDETAPMPPDLYDRLGIAPPNYPELSGNPAERLNKLSDSFKHNKEQFLKVLEDESHDFLFHLISTTDWLQHISYKDLKEEKDNKKAKKARDILKLVDEYIEKVKTRINTDDRLLLLSDHGFKVYNHKFYLNDWLINEGYLNKGKNNIGDKNNNNVVNIGTFGRWLYQRKWLRPLLRFGKNTFESISQKDVYYESGLNVESSTAYCLSKDEYGVRINNSINKKQEKEVLNDIIKKLDSKKGLKAHQKKELYSGSNVQKAADIIIESDKYKILRGPIGVVHESSPIAHHDTYGIIIDAGESSGDQADIEGAELVDVAPTILGLMDVPVPTNIEGSPIEKILSEYTTREGDELYTPNFKTGFNQNHQTVENRLDSLGYL